MLACIFSIEIQTAGQIAMKFGLEVVLEGGMVLGFFTQTPPPRVPLEPQSCFLLKTL